MCPPCFFLSGQAQSQVISSLPTPLPTAGCKDRSRDLERDGGKTEDRDREGKTDPWRWAGDETPRT